MKAGFARIDITPPLGSFVQGYFQERYADGVLDPLLATAVAFDDGERKAIVMSIDVIGMNQIFMRRVFEAITEATGIPEEGIYVACMHTHLGPGIAAAAEKEKDFQNVEYAKWFVKRLADLAVLALQDLAPATMKYTRGEAKDVAFIRRYRMRDGSVRTNPGFLNPDVAGPLGEPDEESQLLIIKREGKPEIGIVNFQVHPDTIGGCKLSADYPKFVRDTYELNVPNSLCMYLNGAQGDSNHFDIRLDPKKDCAHGYDRTRYTGRKIAMSVLSNYELARDISCDKISYAKKYISVPFNKGTPEEEALAVEVKKLKDEKGEEAVWQCPPEVPKSVFIVKCERIVKLMNEPDESRIPLSALSIGDVVFAGFPGEPFTDIGREVKRNSRFTLTIPTCCTNGYEGYYPMSSAFEGGYEAFTARYAKGTAEKIIEASTELVNNLK